MWTGVTSTPPTLFPAPWASVPHSHISPSSWPPQALCYALPLREEECVFAWLGMRYMPGYVYCIHAVQVFCGPPFSFSSPPVSQGGSCFPCRTSGLRHPHPVRVSPLSPFPLSPSGAQSDPIIFLPPPPACVCVALTALTEQASFCQFLVSVQWGLFFVNMCFVCVFLFLN